MYGLNWRDMKFDRPDVNQAIWIWDDHENRVIFVRYPSQYYHDYIRYPLWAYVWDIRE